MVADAVEQHLEVEHAALRYWVEALKAMPCPAKANEAMLAELGAAAVDIAELLYKILEMLFSEQEAGLAALLPIKPFDRATAARIWKMSEAQAGQVLDELAGRGISGFLRKPFSPDTLLARVREVVEAPASV